MTEIDVFEVFGVAEEYSQQVRFSYFLLLPLYLPPIIANGIFFVLLFSCSLSLTGAAMQSLSLFLRRFYSSHDLSSRFYLTSTYSQFVWALLATMALQFFYTIYVNVKMNNIASENDSLKKELASLVSSDVSKPSPDTSLSSSGDNDDSYEAPIPAAKLLDYLLIVGNLKKQKRTGWIDNCVKEPESVADHMYRMGMLSFVIQDPAINRARLCTIGLVHDLAEALVGDITPTEFSGVTKEDKHRQEVAALNEIAGLFKDMPSREKEIKELWWEYENHDVLPTPENEIVKEFDKFEMVIQAYEYEKDQRVLLDGFFRSTAKSFTHPEMVLLHNELLKRREDLHEQWRMEEKQIGTPFPVEQRKAGKVLKK